MDSVLEDFVDEGSIPSVSTNFVFRVSVSLRDCSSGSLERPRIFGR